MVITIIVMLKAILRIKEHVIPPSRVKFVEFHSQFSTGLIFRKHSKYKGRMGEHTTLSIFTSFSKFSYSTSISGNIERS